MVERELLRTYRDATGPAPGQVARVLAARPRGPGRVIAAAVGGALLIGVVALVIPRPPPPLPAPVTEDLGEGVTSIPGLELRADGVGSVAHTPGHASITWVVGALDVVSAPEMELSVLTDDARIVATDADLRVYRDALGTEVSRRRGVVTVTCGGEAPVALGEGGARFCLPVHAAGWLGRAQALAARGAPPSEYRAAADKGLEAGATGSVLAELEVVRIRSLFAEHRDADTLAAVRSYLTAGHLERRAEMLSLGIGLADQLGACDDARSWAGEAGGATLDHCRR